MSVTLTHNICIQRYTHNIGIHRYTHNIGTPIKKVTPVGRYNLNEAERANEEIFDYFKIKQIINVLVSSFCFT